MGKSGLQISLVGMLGLVACVAVNIWLFRVGLIAGLVGVNVTKHVGVAVLCHALGVGGKASRGTAPRPHALKGVPGS